MIVKVRKNGVLYVCQPAPNQIKCGKCQRGNLVTKQGALKGQCAVCKAYLAEVTTEVFSVPKSLREISMISLMRWDR